MRLKRSAWKTHREEGSFPDYILVLPESDVILSFTSMQDDEDKRVVWGCWIRELPDAVVYTALKNAKMWRKESYMLRDNQLTWDNGNGTGTVTWTRIPESDISEPLRNRGIEFLGRLCNHPPPEFEEQNKSEQATPRNASD